MAPGSGAEYLSHSSLCSSIHDDVSTHWAHSLSDFILTTTYEGGSSLRIPFYRWEHEGSEKISNLPKVTQMMMIM